MRVYLAEISSPRSKLLGALGENMPPSKALWQAGATVALRSFIFWSIAAIVLRETRFRRTVAVLDFVGDAAPSYLPNLPTLPHGGSIRRRCQVAALPSHRGCPLSFDRCSVFGSRFLVSPKSWGLSRPSSHGTVLGRTCSKSIPLCDQGGNALTLSRRPPPASALMTGSSGLFAALAPI